MICRVCLQNCKQHLKIFDKKGIQLQIADIVNKHFWFQIFENDNISKVVCKSCWKKIANFHAFYETIKLAHDNYDRLVSLKIEIIENGEDCQVDGKLIDFDSIENSFDIVDLQKLDCKKETLEDDDNDDPLEPHFSQAEISVKTEKAANIQSTEENILKAISKKYSKKSKMSKAKERPRKKRIVKPQIKDEKTEQMIKKHISFGCELCIFSGENFNDIVQHFSAEHKTVKPFILCCERKLHKHFMVKQHAIQHENPEQYKCNNCNKPFVSNSALRAHELVHHMPEEQLKFVCELCPRKFARRYLLERHKSTHTTDKRYACELCPAGKTFASNYVLQVHTSMHHKKSINICHVCGKKIRDNRRFHKHVESHSNESGPRVRCPRPNCNRWLKDEDNLKVHLRYHNDEGKVFECEKCGKNCSSLPALKSHKHYAHSKETFLCEVCQKTFKKALTLREHMAGHTGESLYKCPFCERTFNSNANMHSHKKKMHPVEWENWYKSKYGNCKREKGFQNNLSVEHIIENNRNCKNVEKFDEEAVITKNNTYDQIFNESKEEEAMEFLPEANVDVDE